MSSGSDFEVVLRQAARSLGSGFEPDHFDMAGLRLLLNDAQILPLRSRSLVIGECARHLAGQVATRKHPGPDAAQSRDEIHLTGLPRSGTTLLAWLLAAGGAWNYPTQETVDPIANSPSLEGQLKRRILEEELIPELDGLHPRRPNRPEESDAVAQHVFRGFRLGVLQPSRTYLEWLCEGEADAGHCYCLDQIASDRPVLVKNPFLYAWTDPPAPTRRRNVPLIVLARPFEIASQSWFSFVATIRNRLGSPASVDEVAQGWGWLLTRITDALLAALSVRTDAIVIRFDDLVTAPMETAIKTLEQLGVAVDGQVEGRVRAAHQEISAIYRPQPVMAFTHSSTHPWNQLLSGPLS